MRTSRQTRPSLRNEDHSVCYASKEKVHLPCLLNSPLIDVDLESLDAPRSGQDSHLCCRFQVGLLLDFLVSNASR